VGPVPDGLDGKPCRCRITKRGFFIELAREFFDRIERSFAMIEAIKLNRFAIRIDPSTDR